MAMWPCCGPTHQTSDVVVAGIGRRGRLECSKPTVRFAETCVIIDKLDKIGADAVKKELSDKAPLRFKPEL